jgi:transcriptional regulator with XRE-family HTH domain
MAYGATMARKESSFQTLLKRSRKHRGWTQQDLADRSEIGVRTLIRWAGDDPEPRDLS